MIIAFAAMLFDYKRISIILLGILYLGTFLLLTGTISTQLAIVKLITGGLACSVLWLSITSRDSIQSESGDHGPQKVLTQLFRKEVSGPEGSFIFQFLTGILFIIAIFFLAPLIVNWLPPLQFLAALGGTTILGMGLLKLGFSEEPLQFTIGLLMFILGFDIVYVNLEQSLLVAGLLAMVILGISIIGAYFIMMPDLENT